MALSLACETARGGGCRLWSGPLDRPSASRLGYACEWRWRVVGALQAGGSVRLARSILRGLSRRDDRQPRQPPARRAPEPRARRVVGGQPRVARKLRQPRLVAPPLDQGEGL